MYANIPPTSPAAQICHSPAIAAKAGQKSSEINNYAALHSTSMGQSQTSHFTLQLRTDLTFECIDGFHAIPVGQNAKRCVFFSNIT